MYHSIKNGDSVIAAICMHKRNLLCTFFTYVSLNLEKKNNFGKQTKRDRTHNRFAFNQKLDIKINIRELAFR